jgi:hypothetical protein
LVSRSTACEEPVEETGRATLDSPIIDISPQAPVASQDHQAISITTESKYLGDQQASFDLTRFCVGVANEDDCKSAEEHAVHPTMINSIEFSNAPSLLREDPLGSVAGKRDCQRFTCNGETGVLQLRDSPLLSYPCVKDIGDDIVVEYILGQMCREDDITNLVPHTLPDNDQILGSNSGTNDVLMTAYIGKVSSAFENAPVAPPNKEDSVAHDLLTAQPVDDTLKIIPKAGSNEFTHSSTYPTEARPMAAYSGIPSTISTSAKARQNSSLSNPIHSFHSDSSNLSLAASPLERGLVFRMKHILSCHSPLDSTMIA